LGPVNARPNRPGGFEGSVNARPNGLPPPRTNFVNPLVKLSNTHKTNFVNPLKRINNSNNSLKTGVSKNFVNPLKNTKNNNFVKNAYGKNVTDPISYEPIPKKYAMELNTQMYNARELKKWVNQRTGMSHTVPHSRRPLTQDNLRKIETLARNGKNNTNNIHQWMENQRQYIEKYTQWYKNANIILKKIKEGVHSDRWERELKAHMEIQPRPPQ